MPTIPLETFLDLVVKEWEFVQRLYRRGKIQFVGKLVGRRGAVAVFDVESASEVDQYITQLPLFPYFTRVQVTPLSHTEEALAAAKRMRTIVAAMTTREDMKGDL